MAGSRFAYVRNFELPDPLLPDTYIVLRVDGHSFHRFSEAHEFTKPNDVRALQLMDEAAVSVLEIFPDITLAFGESDEFRQLLVQKIDQCLQQATRKNTDEWVNLKYPPSFDGRIVLYPTEKVVRDYFSWRQADTHINNLYNTAFWALVQEGKQTTTQAHEALRGTNSAQKNQLLFEKFGINYNNIPERTRKGSVVVREVSKEDDTMDAGDKGRGRKKGVSTRIVVLHCDLIREEFWEERRHILSE